MSRTLAILLALLIIGLTSLALGDEATEPILLRYRFQPGDVQCYEAEATFNMTVSGAQGGQQQSVSTVISMRLPFSMRCTELADDGTMMAEIRFHGLHMQMKMQQAGQNMTMTADEAGVRVVQNGTVVMDGAWGSPELSQIPDMRALFEIALGARFTDRGELVEITNLDELPQEFQGFDLTQALDNQVVYPEHPVAPGDSWVHDLSQNMMNATLPSGRVNMVGQARYTVLEQTTYRNRPCLKLAIEADLDVPDASEGMRLDQTFQGTAYIDLATGVPLNTHINIEQDLAGSFEGTEFSITGRGTVILSYIGGKRKYAELARAANDEAAGVLRELHIPMVTETSVTINGKNYAKGDGVTFAGDTYTVVAFKTTALKLHRRTDSAVYQLGLGSGGRVLYVKFLGYAD